MLVRAVDEILGTHRYTPLVAIAHSIGLTQGVGSYQHGRVPARVASPERQRCTAAKCYS
jgi:hypothetical protein